jgi:NAD+ diphosphatase
VEPNTFTGVALDRAEDGRRLDPEWTRAQLEHPNARAVVAGSAGVPVEEGRLALRPLPDEAATQPLLLGVDDEGPVFVVDEDEPGGEGRPALIGAGGRRGEPAPRREGRIGIRDAALRLSQADGGLVAYAAALLNWHRAHRFCANCGAPTQVGEAGLIRSCPRCGTEHHPRVDPVVIMLVTDGDRTLLGRQAVWPAGRYSALAGFVSPAESLEEAVAREVEEEAGVTIEPPEYVSSQPWPFPGSLMLGFDAPWTGGEPAPLEGEIADVRWFSRAEVAAAAALDVTDTIRTDADGAPEGEGLLLPPRLAIARRLVEGWLG